MIRFRVNRQSHGRFLPKNIFPVTIELEVILVSDDFGGGESVHEKNLFFDLGPLFSHLLFGLWAE